MTKEDLLAFLAPDVFVSGERIASALGVTRAAVSKAITALRKDGYVIEAVSNRGYRFKSAPDRLSAASIRSNLDSHPWSERVIVYPSIDSTNTQLRRLAMEGAPAGTVVLAEMQTGGRGRMGRSFLSEAGVGVYLSVLLRPNVEPAALMTLTAQAAVAVSQAIDAVCGICPQIKWVNDLLLNGKKICGILTELSVEAESSRVNYAIVGAGVNCNQAADAFSPELRDIAGSVYAQTGRLVDRNRLAAEMIEQLSRLPEIPWHGHYRAHCVTIGKDVCIHGGAQCRYGTALDVDERAELVVRFDDHSVGTVNSGEVSVRNKEIV